jgi:hypothetical protein
MKKKRHWTVKYERQDEKAKSQATATVTNAVVNQIDKDLSAKMVVVVVVVVLKGDELINRTEYREDQEDQEDLVKHQ